MTRTMVGAALLACLTIAPCLAAPPAGSPGQEERLAELERQVAELTAALEALRAGGGAGGDARLAEIERRLEILAGEIETLKLGEAAVEADVAESGLGPAASKIYRKDRGVSLGGYGEMLYQGFDATRDDGERSGKTDELDFLRAIVYFGYKFADRWLLNTEIEYEHASTGQDGEVSVEFAYLEYLHRPELNVRAGLLLLPVGFINELHEPTVFLGSKRPDVERAIIPTTWRENGAGVWGEAGPVSYRAYVVNGFDAGGFSASGLRGGRQKGSKAKAEDLAFTGRLDWTPAAGLTLGGSFYTGDSAQDLEEPSGEAVSVDTTIVEGHVEYRWRGLQVRALAVRAGLDGVEGLNDALGLTGDESVGETLAGGYLEVGYDVLAGRGRQALIPFARWEAYDTQREVPRGFERDPARDVTSLTVGLSWQPLEQIVVKADWQNYDNEADTAVDQINVALGYIF